MRVLFNIPGWYERSTTNVSFDSKGFTREPRGTANWFVKQRAEIIELVKGLDALATASRSAATLRDEFNTLSDILKEALFTSICINYAKPFSGNRWGIDKEIQTNSKHRISTKLINQSKLYSEDMHKHLIDMRNKMIAHNDHDYVGGDLIYDFRSCKMDGEHFRFQAGATVMSRNVHSPCDISHIKKISSHIEGACYSLYLSMVEISKDYIRDTNEFLDIFSSTRTKEKDDAITWWGNQTLDTDGKPKFQLSSPVETSAYLKNPSLTVGDDGYSYRDISIDVSLEQRIYFETKAGGKYILELRGNSAGPPVYKFVK